MVGSDLDNTPALANPSAKAKGKQPIYEEVRGRSRVRDHWPQHDSPYLGSQHNYCSNEAASSAATAPPSATPSGSSTWRPAAPPVETVGVLLAEIANCLNDTILTLRISDQRHWGTDEIDQVQRLEETLDEAAKDFQELSPLVNGQFYYENDKNPFSLAELSRLSDLFQAHRTTFHEWLRRGGPINPMWANETTHLRQALHRAQCRAARRIFSSLREESHRCLGAHLVQRAAPDRTRTRHTRSSLASVPERASLSSIPDNGSQSSIAGSMTALNSIRGSVTDNEPEQVAACNSIGKFERFGDRDIAFVCDFCDGYIVWEDLTTLPASRTWRKDPQEQAREHKRRSRDRDSFMMRKSNRGPRELILPQYHAQHHSQYHSQQLVNMDAGNRGSVTASEPGTRSSIVSDAPTVTSSGSAVTLHGSGADDGQSEYNWMATGVSVSSVEDDDQVPTEKTIVFAPVAIANHVPPEEGEWQARLLCPYCDDWIVYDQGDGEMEAVRYAQDENGFESLEKLREHLAWYHVPGYLESVAKPVTSVASKATGSGNCVVM